MNPLTTRSHHTVSHPVSRAGCPCEMTSFYQVSEHPKGERTALINQYTTMRLVHMAKNQTIKNSLSLKPIHDFLATESLPLFQSGSSNTLLSLITFHCLIKKTSGE